MSTLEKGTGYALTREQLIENNPRLLEVRNTWADRSAGPDACHYYLNTKDKGGYGLRKIRYKGRNITVLASRIELAIFAGCITADQEAAHMCQKPSCVNPRHLIAAPRKAHNEYDAEPKRLKRMAAQLNGGISFSVWLLTNDDVDRVDWDANAVEERLLAGHLVREMGLPWYEAYRFTKRRMNLPETAELIDCMESFCRNILVGGELSTASSTRPSLSLQ